MKKISYVILCIFLLLGITSCANVLDEIEKDYYANIGNVIVLKNVPTANNIVIERKNVTKNETEVSYSIEVENGAKKVTDYFVNIDQEYSYKITYYNIDYENSYKKTEIETQELNITASNGLGEVSLENIPAAEYDAENSLLKFTEMPRNPSSLKEISNYYKDFHIFSYLKYYLPNGEANNEKDYAMFPEVSSYIDCATAIYVKNNFTDDLANNYYEKDLNFEKMVTKFRINGIWYEFYTFASQLNNFPGSDQPINVKDTKIKLQVESNNQDKGIKIRLNKTANNIPGAKRVRIFKYDKNDNFCGSFSSESLDKVEYIDYFVNSNKQYKYRLQVEGEHESKIQMSLMSDPCSCSNGYGEISLSNLDIKYDSSTGIMKFTPNPLKDFDKIQSEKNVDFRIEYRNPRNNTFLFGNLNTTNNSDKENGEINWGKVIEESSWIPLENRESLYKDELIIDRIGISVTIDGVNNSLMYGMSEISKLLPKVPLKIRIPDNRSKVILESVQNGIKINIPPINEASFVFIDRYNVDNNYEEKDYITIAQYISKKNNVTDYFVSEGTKYKYKVRVFTGSGDSFKEYKSFNSEPMIAPKGIEIINQNDLQQASVVYNTETGIMTITPSIDFTPLHNKLIGIVKDDGIFIEEKIGAVYSKNYDEIVGYIKNEKDENENITGKIDWKIAISNTYNPEVFLGKTVELTEFRANIKIGNVEYKKSINKRFFESIAGYEKIQTITLPNEMRGTEVINNKQGLGLEIKIPSGPEGTKQININRKINKKDGTEEIEGGYIYIDQYNSSSFTEVIDYFVDKENSYSYEIIYSDNNWNIIDRIAFNAPITPTGGVGELNIGATGAEFNQETGEMEFLNNDNYEKLLGDNKINEVRKTLSYKNKYNEVIQGTVDNNTNKINWGKYVLFNKSFANIPLTLTNILINVIIDNVQFSKKINIQDLGDSFKIKTINVTPKESIKDVMEQDIWYVRGSQGKYATVQIIEGTGKSGKMNVLFYSMDQGNTPQRGGEYNYTITENTLTYYLQNNNKEPQTITFVDLLNENCIRINTSVFNSLMSNGDTTSNYYNLNRQIGQQPIL